MWVCFEFKQLLVLIFCLMNFWKNTYIKLWMIIRVDLLPHSSCISVYAMIYHCMHRHLPCIPHVWVWTWLLILLSMFHVIYSMHNSAKYCSTWELGHVECHNISCQVCLYLICVKITGAIYAGQLTSLYWMFQIHLYLSYLSAKTFI